MSEEQKVVRGSLYWIVGMALLGIVTAWLINPAQQPPQDKIGAEETHHSG